MIVTDGPCKTEEFYLKHIINTYSKTLREMCLILLKMHADCTSQEQNYSFHLLLCPSKAPPQLPPQKSRINHANKGRKEKQHVDIQKKSLETYGSASAYVCHL